MSRRPKTNRQRGQVVIIFSLAIFLFMGLCALALDISWYWLNGLRMQRAADAAALAGVVHLPSDPTSAINVAIAEATKNGYQNGIGGVVVTPVQDSSNPRRLRVTITGNVGTYFARVFGFSSFPARKDAKAEYVLPVPMGSPDPYYGIFGLLRHPGGGVTTVTTNSGNTGWLPASATKGTSTWTTPGNVYVSDNTRATSATNNQAQAWGNFAISPPAGAT
ncbi:MAG TPA: pilus assembly protein TadG-related protein, partial [Candidatus Limnocylindrales bacterium]